MSFCWEEGYGSVWGGPCPCLCWVFGIGDYVSKTFICVVFMLLLRAVFKHSREIYESKKAYVFIGAWCFSLSVPCDMLILLCFIVSWTWVVVSVMVHTCIFCVDLPMDLFVLSLSVWTVLVRCFGKKNSLYFLGVIAIFFCWMFSVGGPSVWQTMYGVRNVVYGVHLDDPSIGCVCVCRKTIRLS